jgi:uncharacterized protein (TIGR03067 family)
MFARAIFLFAACLLIATTLPAQDTKGELDKLQGEWTWVSGEVKGVKGDKDKNAKQKLVIKGDQWILTVPQGETQWTIKIDASKDPKWIDITRNDKKEIEFQGIYKLEGDTLSVCRIITASKRDRPKEFKTTAESGQLLVWKRVK